MDEFLKILIFTTYKEREKKKRIPKKKINKFGLKYTFKVFCLLGMLNFIY